MTVACVLRSGGPYDASYVERLERGVAEHLTGHEFVCLSDVPVPCTRIPLRTDWPRNWAKIELFTPGLFDGPVMFIDLDTDVVGDLSEIASYSGPFAMIDDWLHPRFGASGVMLWHETAKSRTVYESFKGSYPGALESFRRDQRWIHMSVDGWDPLRELYPGQIVSRWCECIDEVPQDARLVCWHGTPRPHEIDWAPTGHLEDRHPSWHAKMRQMGYVA